jgi:hypothetical protein
VIAQAVAYGEGKPTGSGGRERVGRVEIASPSLERIRTCQSNYSLAAVHVRHRDERAPYWLLYEYDGGTGVNTAAGGETASALRAAAVVVAWFSTERYAWIPSTTLALT